jgi:hypothetical protein
MTAISRKKRVAVVGLAVAAALAIAPRAAAVVTNAVRGQPRAMRNLQQLNNVNPLGRYPLRRPLAVSGEDTGQAFDDQREVFARWRAFTNSQTK